MNISNLLAASLMLLVVSAFAEARSAKVAVVNGAPQLLVDGRATVPLVFMGIPTGAAMRVRVGPEWKRVQVGFISPETAEGAPGFQIRMGGPQGPGKLWVDDLRYYEGTPQQPTGPNMQPHGDFEDTGDALPPNWMLFVWPGTSARATWAYDETTAASGRRSLRCDIEDGGDGLGRVHLFLSGCRVVEGKRYTVELSLRADPEREVDLAPLHQAPPWTHYPVVGVRTPYTDQVELAGKAGVHLQYPIVGMPWPRPGEKPDYSSLDNVFRQTIEADPEALIIIRYGLDPPQWWLDERPQAKNFCHDGTPAQQWVGDEEWIQEACRWQEEMIRHIQQRWGDRIIAYHPCGQHTGEWFYIGGWENRIPCFGEGVDRSFRKWLMARYKTLEALCASWKRQVGSWEEISAPGERERRTGELGEFLDPRTQRNVIDFFEFTNYTMARAVSEVARSCKRAAPDKAVIVFYGYLYELAGWAGGIGTTGHYGWSWLIDDPNIDIFCSPISYANRELGGLGQFMAPVDSVAAHGKQWFNEDDTRTLLANDSIGRVSTLEGSQWVHLRNFAHIFPRRMGCWYMDLGATGWLNDARLWDNIARLRELYEAHLADPCRFAPEIAVITDERSARYTRVGSVLPVWLLSNLRPVIYRIGAPVGWYLMDDLLAGKVPPAKLYIMHDAFVLDAAQRARLVEIFRRQKATALWFYAPGYLDPDGGPVPPEAIEKLTGFRLVPLAAGVPDTVTPAAESDLCAGLGESFGSAHSGLQPQLAVQRGPRVEAVARYPGGEIAAAATDAAGYPSVFVSSLAVPPELLRNIAQRAGAHIYCDSNDMIEGDGHFLAICATSEGEKVLRLVGPAKVTDALTGEVIGQGRETRFPLALGEVRLMWVDAL